MIVIVPKADVKDFQANQSNLKFATWSYSDIMLLSVNEIETLLRDPLLFSTSVAKTMLIRRPPVLALSEFQKVILKLNELPHHKKKHQN